MRIDSYFLLFSNKEISSTFLNEDTYFMLTSLDDINIIIDLEQSKLFFLILLLPWI